MKEKQRKEEERKEKVGKETQNENSARKDREERKIRRGT